MTSSDEWIPPSSEGPRLIAMTQEQLDARLQEAIERGKAEPPDLTWFWDAVDADGLADVPSDEVGALHRLRRLAARAEAAEAKLARLDNPDDALVEAVAKMTYDGITHDEAVALCRDLARTLEGKENSDAE